MLKKSSRERVDVRVSRRYEASTRKGAIWGWAKKTHSNKELSKLILDAATILVSALHELSRGTIPVGDIRRSALLDFAQLLDLQIDGSVIPTAEPPPVIPADAASIVSDQSAPEEWSDDLDEGIEDDENY